MTNEIKSSAQGPKLPEKGTFLDERFWLEKPDGSVVMYGWTGTEWVTDDVVFIIQKEIADWDQPAKLKPEGFSMPFNIFNNTQGFFEGPVEVLINRHKQKD